MSLTYFFFAYALTAGLAVGAMLAYLPPATAASVPPFITVLIALAVFDGLCLLRSGGAPEGLISMPVRFAGLAVALATMAAVSYFAGIPFRIF